MSGYTRAQIVDGTGWSRDTRFIPVHGDDPAEFARLVARANKAAYGDSGVEFDLSGVVRGGEQKVKRDLGRDVHTADYYEDE